MALLESIALIARPNQANATKLSPKKDLRFKSGDKYSVESDTHYQFEVELTNWCGTTHSQLVDLSGAQVRDESSAKSHGRLSEAPRAFVVDKTPPAAAAALMAPTSDSGLAGDATTSDTTPWGCTEPERQRNLLAVVAR